MGLRFAAVAAILLPFVGRPTRRVLGPMIAISVFFGGLSFALFFVGLGRGLASMSAVADQLSTPLRVLLAWPLLGERPLTRLVIGVALAFGGVALTVAKPSASVKIVPTLLLIVIELGQLASLHTASLTAWFAYTVLFARSPGGLWLWLIARCSMTRVAPFALLQTVFAVVTGVALLHEPLTPMLVAGAVICTVGVATTQSRFSSGIACRQHPTHRSSQPKENACDPGDGCL